jgi:hypothetical protein
MTHMYGAAVRRKRFSSNRHLNSRRRAGRDVKSDGDAWNTRSLAEEPLRLIYAYTEAESDAPQKFVLDPRGKSATPEAIQASQNNLTDVGAVAP